MVDVVVRILTCSARATSSPVSLWYRKLPLLAIDEVSVWGCGPVKVKLSLSL